MRKPFSWALHLPEERLWIEFGILPLVSSDLWVFFGFCFKKEKRNTLANQQGELVLESVWLFSILSKFNGVNGLYH